MSRPYSPLAILRAVPRDLLRAYCAEHQVPFDPRLFADDTTPSQTLALALGLGTPAVRPWFDGALRHVHEMGTEGGTLALVAEAHYERLDLPPEYHALAGPEARALWFLTYLPAVFHAARLQHTADHLADRHSTAVAGLPEGIPPHSLAELGEFRRALAEYFLLT